MRVFCTVSAGFRNFFLMSRSFGFGQTNAVTGFKLESLILAQNERWRQA